MSDEVFAAFGGGIVVGFIVGAFVFFFIGAWFRDNYMQRRGKP